MIESPAKRLQISALLVCIVVVTAAYGADMRPNVRVHGNSIEYTTQYDGGGLYQTKTIYYDSAGRPAIEQSCSRCDTVAYVTLYFYRGDTLTKLVNTRLEDNRTATSHYLRDGYTERTVTLISDRPKRDTVIRILDAEGRCVRYEDAYGTTSYTYNERGDLTRLEDGGEDGGSTSAYTYEYDRRGRILKQVRTVFMNSEISGPEFDTLVTCNTYCRWGLVESRTTSAKGTTGGRTEYDRKGRVRTVRLIGVRNGREVEDGRVEKRYYP